MSPVREDVFVDVYESEPLIVGDRIRCHPLIRSRIASWVNVDDLKPVTKAGEAWLEQARAYIAEDALRSAPKADPMRSCPDCLTKEECPTYWNTGYRC